MTRRVRVLVYYAAPAEDADAVIDAFRSVNDGMRGTSGLLSSQLLRSALDPDEFAVLSEWTSLPEFRSWEEGAAHKGQTSGLRRYRGEPPGRAYGVYEVVDQL